MVRVIGVRFRTAGKIYFFDPLEFEIKKGDHVIVETARGIEFGTVMAGAMEVSEEKVVQPLKPVIRIANQRDVEQEEANRGKEKEAFRICLEKIRDHGLEMKLIDAEYTFDNNKVLFYFTADGRIDFRELVKDLASVFKTRIELRQIGVRDETKIVGGIGICGRPLCCHSYLADFVPVSIKMAKEQNLSLNPAKISGVCGRLMCCLKNEEETYEELNRRLPGIGDSVTTEEGQKGTVQSVNVLRQLVKVVIDAGDEKEIKEYPVEKLYFRRRHSKKEKMELSKEELQELERLEEEEWQRQEQELMSRAEEAQRQNARNRQGSRRPPAQQGGEGQRPPVQRTEVDRRPGQRAEGRQQGQRGGGQQRQGGRRFETEQRQQTQRPGRSSPRRSAPATGAATTRPGIRTGTARTARTRETVRTAKMERTAMTTGTDGKGEPRRDSGGQEMARLKEGERIDDLERNGYRIIQHPEKFCFGMDAVLLTGFARARRSDRLLDLGTGTGIIPLLMEAKYGCAHLTGLEIQAESADMAERSVELNGLSDRIEIVTGDIKEADHLFPSASFDCITCNPPYMIGQHGIANPDAPKAIARHEILCTFSDVAAQAEKLLKPGGHFFLVHRPFRLAEIITELVRRRLEPKRMQLVYPYVDREPNMVLLEAVRGGRPRMTVEKPLIVFREPGVYMPEIREIYGY